MFHLINGIAITCSLQQTHSSERLIIANLDLRNAFNEESRQLIYDFFASGCHTPPSQEASHHTWKGWDILWRHFEAHYSTPGLLKFYHSGQVHHISSKPGTQQGDPLGTVLFSAPLQRILHQVADAHPEILIFAFADNGSFAGPQDQVLQVIDTYHQSLVAANLRLNPSESNIYIPLSQQDPLPYQYLTTPQGIIIPCTASGIKMLGAPIGSTEFATEQFRKTANKIEKDLSLLKMFPQLHQRVKLLTFDINTRLNYFLRTTPPPISSSDTNKLDESVDKFWAYTLRFPSDYENHQEATSYLKALQQIRLGIRDGGCGCYYNKHIIHAAYYSSVADTIQWLHKHPIKLPSLQNSLTETLNPLIQPSIDFLHQTWNIPVATPRRVCRKISVAKPIFLSLSPPHNAFKIGPTNSSLLKEILTGISRRSSRPDSSTNSLNHSKTESRQWANIAPLLIEIPISPQTSPPNLNFGNVQPHCFP